MSGKRFSKGKGRKAEKPPPKKFDPSELIGDVDLTNKDVQIYLVKMPDQLAQQFEDPSNGVVGRLRIADQSTATPNPENPSEKQQSKIFVDKVVSKGGPKERQVVSTEYDVQLQRQNPNILIFSVNAEEKEDDARLEGFVSYQCQARPVMTDTYRKLNSARTYYMNKSSSKMLVMDSTQLKAAERVSLRPSAMMATAKEREEMRRAKENSRRHLDVPDEVWKENTRLHIFKAFEIQPYYTADELATTVGETATRIRPIIGEVCAYNKSGPSAGRYELKDEFKTVAQRQAKERELAEYQRAQAEATKKRKEERAEREKEDSSKNKKARLG